MLIRILVLFFLIPIVAGAQSPTVPSRMEFAGIKLRLTEDARKEIQKDVNALTKSPKYFNIKVERAKSYFPIIERVFREEGLHEDFKYLVLQESALIPDAVSVSDAVGFWQFKDFTALEVGLRVDNHIDERMNIVSASHGAARYMKKNNQFFDNWLHSLQAYQMGPGGAMRVLGKGDRGANAMVIDKKTYWYVKKYLAHKVAFENAVDGAGETKLVEYTKGRNKSLKDISRETGVDMTRLEAYNKWLRKGKIPDDRAYAVFLPISRVDKIEYASLESASGNEVSRKVKYKFPTEERFPEMEDYKDAQRGSVVDINGVPGVIGRSGDDMSALARKGDIDLSRFLKYNDVTISDPVVEGQVYYFKSKRDKGPAHYYVAQPGETLWSISQKFGIKLKKLKMKNRIRGEEKIKAGRVLWLRYIRPARIAIEYRQVEAPERKEEVTVVKNDIPEQVVEPFQPAPAVNKEPENADKRLIAHQDSVELAAVVTREVQEPEPQEEENTWTGEDDDEDARRDQEEIEEVQEPEDEPQRSKKMHVVQPGETLYAISKQHDVTVRELLEWNDLNISDGISINQKLVVLGNLPGKELVGNKPNNDVGVFVHHTVGQGDTLYGIARSYDVTIEELMSWNDKKDFSVNLGEKIKVRKRQAN